MDQKSRLTSILKVTIKLTQQTQNICIGLTFVKRRPNVEDVGPTLYKC